VVVSGDERPVKLFVGADQVDVDEDVAVVSLSFKTAEDFARKFLRTVMGEDTTED
jgi:hypothetical protein